MSQMHFDYASFVCQNCPKRFLFATSITQTSLQKMSYILVKTKHTHTHTQNAYNLFCFLNKLFLCSFAKQVLFMFFGNKGICCLFDFFFIDKQRRVSFKQKIVGVFFFVNGQQQIEKEKVKF